MECVEMALMRRASGPRMTGFGCCALNLKQAPLPVFLVDDSWAANNAAHSGVGGGGGGSGSDDSFVDQLLNLNNDNAEDGGPPLLEESHRKDDDKAPAFPSPPPTSTKIEPQADSFNFNRDSPKDDFGAVLTVPEEEPDLEWLSQFVEDSFSQFSTPSLPGGGYPLKPCSEIRTPAAPALALTKSKRSKRARTGGRIWSFGSSSLTESTTASSSSSTSSSPPSPSATRITSIPESTPQPAAKKHRKPTEESTVGGVSVSLPAARSCSHCGVQKTPQWRTGPNGAKTLCNACGVRYKSGRLLPEYRPACSPTFSSEIHSNSHRKVLEMRRKKEDMMLRMMSVGGRTGSDQPGYTGPVPSFV